MSISEVMRKYLDVVTNTEFTHFEKEFAGKLAKVLSSGYQKKAEETELVELIEKLTNKVDNLAKDGMDPFFRLATSSIFIHGYKSQVKFDYYGNTRQRELGDLIFVISVIYKNTKWFERLTVCQFKRDHLKRSKNGVKWTIDNKEQLYLLSKFPVFMGVPGSMIRNIEHALPNYSECLGSYGLLHTPGDFCFVSAQDLDTLLAGRQTVKRNELLNLKDASLGFWQLLTQSWLFDKVGRHFLFDLYEHPGFNPVWPYGIFGNYHLAQNTFDFAHKYLSVGIGEPTVLGRGIANIEARALLRDIMSAIRSRAIKEGQSEWEEFTNRFFVHKYADDKGLDSSYSENVSYNDDRGSPTGGFGIINTVIDLGE